MFCIRNPVLPVDRCYASYLEARCELEKVAQDELDAVANTVHFRIPGCAMQLDGININGDHLCSKTLGLDMET